MGWWSETIMGGDLPLYWDYDIAKVMKIDMELYHNLPNQWLTKSNVEDTLLIVIQYIINQDDIYTEKLYGWHVLCKNILYTGAKISSNVKSFLLEKISKDDLNAGWNNPKTREFYLKDLYEKVENHEEHKQTLLTEESLLEKFNNWLKDKGEVR